MRSPEEMKALMDISSMLDVIEAVLGRMDPSSEEYILDEEIDGVYFNGLNTTVRWSDGDVTTVGCADAEKYDEYTGLVYCIVQHYLNNDKQLFHKELKHQIEKAVRQNTPTTAK